jgi:transposase
VKIAVDEAGILLHFIGVLCHANHIRELERAWEHDGMQWAKGIQSLLKEINKAQIDNPNLDKGAKQKYSEQYQEILAQGDAKCPPPDESSRVKSQ